VRFVISLFRYFAYRFTSDLAGAKKKNIKEKKREQERGKTRTRGRGNKQIANDTRARERNAAE